MFQDIESSFINIVSGTENFIIEIEKSEQDIDKLNSHVNQVFENESIFLEKMDSIVFSYDEQSKSSVQEIIKTHIFLFLLIIINMIFVATKIFIPLIDYVDNAFLKFNESNKNLSKIFKTMKGALFVTKKDGEIVFMNNDAEKIIYKENKGNETLYIGTSLRWIAFDIKSLIEKVKDNDMRIDGIETTIEDKDGKIISVVLSAVSGKYDGDEVVIFNMFDITLQKKAEDILRNTAIKDELTGLYNRHFLESIMEGEFGRAERYKIPLSVILLDLDYFKRVNDNWGHPVGDTVLKLTADIVKENIRKSDFAIRIGGEEFLILMPNTDLKGAAVTAEKLRLKIEKTSHPIIGSFTASFGVAERNIGEKYQNLYHRVDEALYKAKENGRNAVALSEKEYLENKTTLVKWNEKWQCGEENIDKQHKEVFEFVSELLKVSKSTDEKQNTISHINDIISGMNKHFEYEEKILIKANYKDIYNHKKIHNGLIKRLEEIKKYVKMDTLDSRNAFTLIFDEIIVGHLLCEDVKFYPYIKNLD